MTTADRAVTAQANAYNDYINCTPQAKKGCRVKLDEANEEMRRIKRLINLGVKVP